LTLIEIIIAMAIVSLLFAAVVVSAGAITGTKAKSATAELAGVIRSLYDTAALSGKTCRLVFQLPGPRGDGRTRYWAECAAGNVTTHRDRDETLRAEQRREREKQPARDQLRPASREPTLQELMAMERDRVEAAAKYSNFTSPEIEAREIAPAVKLSVWTKNQREAISSGTAYLYFFPQGFTEKAMIFVAQGKNVWTISVQPLTGKAQIFGEQLEVPRS
jgi:general secretion pathway protein H